MLNQDDTFDFVSSACFQDTAKELAQEQGEQDLQRLWQEQLGGRRIVFEEVLVDVLASDDSKPAGPVLAFEVLAFQFHSDRESSSRLQYSV